MVGGAAGPHGGSARRLEHAATGILGDRVDRVLVAGRTPGSRPARVDLNMQLMLSPIPAGVEEVLLDRGEESPPRRAPLHRSDVHDPNLRMSGQLDDLVEILDSGVLLDVCGEHLLELVARRPDDGQEGVLSISPATEPP
jgi:hypothetical protein